MSEWIKNLFVAIFGSNSWLATIIISMIPIVELRGAIPFGSAISFGVKMHFQFGNLFCILFWEALLFVLF